MTGVVSVTRANYAASRLGVKIAALDREPAASYDVFFSSHVIEHVPDPARMLADGLRILRPGGLFLAVTPNGSSSFRAVSGRAWSRLWGEVHPQLISDEWVLKATDFPCFISSLPIDLSAVRAWDRGRTVSPPLDGWELVFAVRGG